MTQLPAASTLTATEKRKRRVSGPTTERNSRERPEGVTEIPENLRFSGCNERFAFVTSTEEQALPEHSGAREECLRERRERMARKSHARGASASRNVHKSDALVCQSEIFDF
ncbi:hypothetical protein [Haladaptatus sp. NG-SE-30]